MNRSILLFSVAILIAAVAITLRVSNHQASPPNQTNDTTPVNELPEPGDYVAHPIVAVEEIANGPKRIISMAPNITETLCALGLGDRFVGRTQYCKYPPQITEVETIGALFDANYDRIVALKPDAIFVTANSTTVISQLERLDLPYIAVPHETFDDVFKAFDLIGQYCNRPRTATALSRLVRSDLDMILHATGHTTPLQVVISTGEMPVPARPVFVAGPDAFLDELLRMLGHHNATKPVCHKSFGEIPIEKLIEIDPDVILEFRDNNATLDDVYTAWSQVGTFKAITQHRIHTVGGLEWLSAGPRVALTLRRMATALGEHNERH